jgi:pilus assembly protein FimV
MAFNKTKALESALKFLNQGKVAQAIGEYQQILRHDPKDQATLMTVGDLFARQGEMGPAVEYFERLAQVYLSDGFNSKAIAIYKKIAKLAPAELAPLERLADLYVQQGVLSEARPLFLQIAEAHLKANRAAKAVEVLQRLLDVEPDNPRVQMRLAELYNVMGQKKEAGQVYYNYAQRLYERGEDDEAQKLIERALTVEAAHPAATLLKARILARTNKAEAAIAILDSHPEVEAGGEVTNLIVDLELAAEQFDKAADRGRNQLVRGSAHSALLQKVCESLIETGRAKQAVSLLCELREPLIETSEHDKFVKLLSSAIEKLPGDAEPLEMLADFARHTSDPFQLTTALNKLVDLYAETDNLSRAEELMQELVDRNKGDERLIAKLEQLRARRTGQTMPPAAPEPEPQPTMAEVTSREHPPAPEPSAQPAPTAPAAAAEEPLEEETQRYIAQALTDVDLFSSYGLTQKATQLLENVLQRAPRHTPTLERLLDLCLGAGNERRTAELAAQLEQIYLKRSDTINAERFAELRQRFQKAAGLTEEDLAATTESPAAQPVAAATTAEPSAAEPEAEQEIEPAVQPATSAPVEFEIPLEPEPAKSEALPAEPVTSPTPEASAPPAPITTEVDLSDEWEAMVQELAEPAPTDAMPEAAASVTEEVAEPEVTEPAEEPEAARAEMAELEVAKPEPEIAEFAAPEPVAAQSEEIAAPSEEPVETHEPAPIETPEPTFEFDEEPEPETPAPEPESAEFELELSAEPTPAESHSGPATTEDFLSELAAEIEDMQSPEAEHEPSAEAVASEAAEEPVPELSPASLNELAEVFEEFRAELGEMNEDEDLETHYNLGIAYREMGLLDEAIGEFQKVAKAVQKGRPFPYAMNCAALLALSFMDKSEPKIAALWYQRALDLPKLDQEAVLALRYDLGVALDMAGEADRALDSFRQVYAMNIDYRDVADRIATLQKH